MFAFSSSVWGNYYTVKDYVVSSFDQFLDNTTILCHIEIG